MLEYEDSSKSSVWTDNSLSVKGPWQMKYTLLGNNYDTPVAPAGNLNLSTNIADIKTYASGTLWVGTEGVTSGTCGEVFAEYDIELYRPGVFAVPQVMTSLTATGAASSTVMFPTATTFVYGTNFAYFSTNGNTVVFNELPAGSFLFILTATGLSGAEASNINFSVPTGYTFTQTNFVNNSNLPYLVSNSSTSSIIIYSVQLPQPTQFTCTITGFTHLSTSGPVGLRCVSYDVPNYG